MSARPPARPAPIVAGGAGGRPQGSKDDMTPPRTIDLGGARVTLQWEDATLVLPSGVLRANCQCTACRQAAAGGGVTVRGDVEVTGASPIGGYGVQFHFSDGHERGIFPWTYLRRLAGA